MSRFFTSACVVLLVLLIADIAQGAVVTIEGTVKSVDAKKRTITVQAKTETLEFDVSRKAKVSVKGKTAKIDSLKQGQLVKISYHDGLEIVLKIEVQGKGLPAPQLVVLRELNSQDHETSPWVSPDGLKIWWTVMTPKDGEKWVWTAKRKDSQSLFEGKKRLMPGEDPTLTSDGLELFLSQDKKLYMSKRETVDQPFPRVRQLNELSTFGFLKDPCISEDGLVLCFDRIMKGKTPQLCYSQRSNRLSKWSVPRPLRVATKGKKLHHPHLAANGRYLFRFETKQLGGTIMIFKRNSLDDTFEEFGYAGTQELVVRGLHPRYVPSTQELFLVSDMKESGGNTELIVLKNFVPDKMVIRPR